MSGWLSGRVNAVAGWVVRRRSNLPAPLRRGLESVLQRDTWIGRLALRSSGAIEPDPIAVPDAPIRLYLGPANYAGQAYEWARSVERQRPDVAARNAAFQLPEDFDFPADYRVPLTVYAASAHWQRAQLQSIVGFSHVVIESFTSLLGNHWRGSLHDEVEDLRSRGLQVAFMCHGTDIRVPSRHRELNSWSPFQDDERTRTLEETALRNHRLLAELGGTAFISTPDLFVDLPDATWCPVVVNVDSWTAAAQPLLTRERPIVVHIPSAGTVKGTALIMDAMRRLDADGIIEFRTVTGVPHEQMPAQYGQADIVLDQFRIGSYGVAACEALAAGRVVLGHVSQATRSAVLERTGREVPIIEATADTISDVLLDVVRHPDRHRPMGDAGIDFVRDLHDGRRSAEAMAGFLALGGRS